MNNNYLQPSINSTTNIHLKGNSTVPTQPAGTNNTTIANTKFVTDLVTPIIWAPAGGGNAETFEEAYALLQSRHFPSTVYLVRNSDMEPLLTVPAGTWELANVTVTTLTYGNPSTNQVHILDGAVLRNPGEVFRSCSIKFESSSPVLEYDGLSVDSPPIMYLGLGSYAENDGTAPCYIVSDNSLIVLVLLGGTIIAGLNSQPIIELGENAVCILRLEYGAVIDTTAITGPASSTIIVQNDGETKFSEDGLVFSGFSGTILNQPLGVVGGAGPTSFRPFTGDPSSLPSVGCAYFDTDLGYQINWNGTQWVDSTGSPV